MFLSGTGFKNTNQKNKKEEEEYRGIFLYTKR